MPPTRRLPRSTACLVLARRTAVSTLVRCAATAAALLAIQVAPTSGEMGSTAGVEDRPAISRTERLVARHGCWTDTAPPGVDPTHAVVTRPGGRAEWTVARVGFEMWLGERAGVVHAFCP